MRKSRSFEERIVSAVLRDCEFRIGIRIGLGEKNEKKRRLKERKKGTRFFFPRTQNQNPKPKPQTSNLKPKSKSTP
jgi:hypothetical protein